jgi:transposase
MADKDPKVRQMDNETNSYVEGLSRSQTFLLPKTIEQYVEQDNPVRFIDAYVNTLDMEKLGFTHSTPQELGRPSYNPKDLCKLYLYGGLNHIQSSRKLERECKTNLEAMWLLKGLAPDFKTIADFRKDNPLAIGALFKAFVAFLKDLSLFGAKQVTVDGTKLRAANSNDKAFTQRALAKRIKVMEKSVKHYLEELDAADEQEASDEQQANSESGEDAKAFEVDKLAALLDKKEKSEAILDKMQKSGQKEVALTDPDCRQMMSHGRVESCYNMQAAVDSKNHLIVNYLVTNEASDLNQLSGVAISAKETLGVEQIDCISDKGYFDFMQIKQCVDCGVTPYVAVKRSGSGGSIVSPEFTADKFRYYKSADVYVCPAGQRLNFHCSTNQDGMDKRVYKCQKSVCSSCQFFMTKCTSNKIGRLIWRWVHEEVVDDLRMRMKSHPEVMGERKKVVEHTFGTLKRAFGAPYLLLRGLRKVSGEVGLLLISYNLRRALNILGVQGLIQALLKNKE